MNTVLPGVIVYVVIRFAIGLLVSRQIANEADYLLAGGRPGQLGHGRGRALLSTVAAPLNLTAAVMVWRLSGEFERFDLAGVADIVNRLADKVAHCEISTAVDGLCQHGGIFNKGGHHPAVTLSQ